MTQTVLSNLKLPSISMPEKRSSGCIAISVAGRLHSLILLLLAVFWIDPGFLYGQANPEEKSAGRLGYLVDVELPIVGDRDQSVQKTLKSILDRSSADRGRPLVALKFHAEPVDGVGAAGSNAARGSQFERCLALARYLTSAEVSQLRLVAYVDSDVVGHALLPILACEEIRIAPAASIGKATIDDVADPTIVSSYQDVVDRRRTLPKAIVEAMLRSGTKVIELQLNDGNTIIETDGAADELRNAGRVTMERTLWDGAGLATFSGQQLRNNRWASGLANDQKELADQLGLKSGFQRFDERPDEWNAAALTVTGSLPRGRVNQIIRSIDATISSGSNLIVLRVSQVDCSLQNASRLAFYLADLKPEVRTVGIAVENLNGPIGLVVAACDEAILLEDAVLGPTDDSESAAVGRKTADQLSRVSGRPSPLLDVLLDSDVQVHEFINQKTGDRVLLSDWQITQQDDPDVWLAKRRIAGGEPIPQETSLQYGLVDSVEPSLQTTLTKLGLQELPPELSNSWVDVAVEFVVNRPWIPRLLLTVAMFALMAELANPGLGAGGFISAVGFVGFFWIEGLNGNVEALEIILFIVGAISIALEVFVIPGFGIFGIGGLLMLFVSIVLASQTFVWPSSSAELNEVAVNLFWVACMALGGMIGLLFMHQQLERLPFFRFITLQPISTEEQAEYADRESLVHLDYLLDQAGITTTRLNPSGKAQFGGHIVQVVGSGGLIPEGQPVKVVEVRGNLVIVEPV